MTTEANAIIREVEEQRLFFATRCTKFAAHIAAMQAVITAQEHENTALRAENAALKQPPEVT